MEPKWTVYIEGDGPALVFTRDGDQLVVQQDDDSPEPLGNGPLYVLWVPLPGYRGVPRLRTVYVADDLEADRVVIDTPYVKGHILVRGNPARSEPPLGAVGRAVPSGRSRGAVAGRAQV